MSPPAQSPTKREEGNERASDRWVAYRAWFWAAAVYNAAWGTVVGLHPQFLLRIYGLTAAQQAAAGTLPAILASCIGMFVGVYAIGYACVAIDPQRFWPFAAIGLAGKVLGPAGWAVQHFQGHLAWPSIWVNITNDFIWWPAFIGLLVKVARRSAKGLDNWRTSVPESGTKHRLNRRKYE